MQVLDLVVDECRELRVHLLRRRPEHGLKRLIEVHPQVEGAQQLDHRREAMFVDQHLAQEAPLVVAEEDPRATERAVELTQGDQVLIRVCIDQVAPHIAAPCRVALDLFPRGQALRDPTRAAVVREPEVDDVAEFVEACPRPREAPSHSRQRRDRGYDGPKANSEGREPGEANRTHREVLMLAEDGDGRGPGCVSVALGELFAGFCVVRDEVGAEHLGCIRLPAEAERSLGLRAVRALDALEHQRQIRTESVAPALGRLLRFGQGLAGPFIVAGVGERFTEGGPGFEIQGIPLNGGLEEVEGLAEAIELAQVHPNRALRDGVERRVLQQLLENARRFVTLVLHPTERRVDRPHVPAIRR